MCPQYIKNFYNETLEEDYDLTSDERLLTILYSLTVSIFAIGGMIGALMVGRLVTKYGRLVWFIVWVHSNQTVEILCAHTCVSITGKGLWSEPRCWSS